MTEVENLILSWQRKLDDYKPFIEPSQEYLISATIRRLKELQKLKGEEN